MAKTKLKAVATPKLIKLDLGCGKNKRSGYEGVDARAFEGVDHVLDLRKAWPWKDATVEAAVASHFVEHLDADERIHFVNELFRVLIPGGKCEIITPHWASSRAYGDLTHKWPPVAEMWFYYLKREWREQNAAHNDGYTCDFDVTWGYALRPELSARNDEYKMHALQNFKEAATDLIATMAKPTVATGGK